jgi:hypothetical protein
LLVATLKAAAESEKLKLLSEGKLISKVVLADAELLGDAQDTLALALNELETVCDGVQLPPLMLTLLTTLP